MKKKQIVEIIFLCSFIFAWNVDFSTASIGPTIYEPSSVDSFQMEANKIYITDDGYFPVEGGASYVHQVSLVYSNLYVLYWGNTLEDFRCSLKKADGSVTIFEYNNGFGGDLYVPNALVFEVDSIGLYELTITDLHPAETIGSIGFSGMGILDVPEITPDEELSPGWGFPSDPLCIGYLEYDIIGLDYNPFPVNLSKPCCLDHYVFEFDYDSTVHVLDTRVDYNLDQEYTLPGTGRYVVYGEDFELQAISVNETIEEKTSISGFSGLLGFSLFGLGMIVKRLRYKN